MNTGPFLIIRNTFPLVQNRLISNNPNESIYIKRQSWTNSCLDALPTYVMGLFLLQDGVHAKLYSIRARFFWEGSGPSRKYHWLNWPAVCRPMECGGLGLVNTKTMNTALMLKWIWKLYQEDGSIWHLIVKAKYPEANNFLASPASGGSPFWRSLHKIKVLFKLGVRHVVGNGVRTLFWSDRWIGDGPLSRLFPRLFDICSDPAISVAEAFAPNSEGIVFRRTLDRERTASWEALAILVDSVALQDDPDRLVWALEPSGVFSVASMYRQLSQGATVAHAKDLWGARLPLKIKIFSWQLALDRLPAGKQLADRLGPSDGHCALCGGVEDATHIFFACPLARFGWSAVRQLLGCNWSPANFPQFHALLQPLLGQHRRLCWIIVCTMFWALWLTRNKLTIEHKVLRHPADLLFKMLMFIQCWARLSKDRDQAALLEMAGELRAIYASLAPSSAS